MSDPGRQSPLVGQKETIRGNNKPIAGGATLFERPFLGHISLRGRDNDPAFTSACAKVLGAALPVTPNTVAESADLAICWLRPTAWLVLCGADTQQRWMAQLRDALGDMHAAVTDLSGGQTLIAVRGAHAADVLAKGTPLDLHPRVFGAGRCARTVLARTTALIRVIEPGQSFEIVVRRSFADYLWQWLRDAADEYDCQILAAQPTLELTDTSNRQREPAVELATAR